MASAVNATAHNDEHDSQLTTPPERNELMNKQGTTPTHLFLSGLTMISLSLLTGCPSDVGVTDETGDDMGDETGDDMGDETSMSEDSDSDSTSGDGDAGDGDSGDGDSIA